MGDLWVKGRVSPHISLAFVVRTSMALTGHHFDRMIKNWR